MTAPEKIAHANRSSVERRALIHRMGISIVCLTDHFSDIPLRRRSPDWLRTQVRTLVRPYPRRCLKRAFGLDLNR